MAEKLTSIGHFDVISVLGEGTYGVVLKCKDTCTGQHVAIKRFREEKRMSSSHRKSANREYHFLTSLRHPNIIHQLTAFTINKLPHLVLELLDCSLLSVIQKHTQGVCSCVVRNWGRQLLLGLEYLHNRDVAHRDIKPENVLIGNSPAHTGLCQSQFNPEFYSNKEFPCNQQTTKECLSDEVGTHVKICDLGFARSIPRNALGEVIARRDEVKDSDALGGTPAKDMRPLTQYVSTRWYRSPELLLGHDYTHSIDVWALGCVISELATGIPLFPGSDDDNQWVEIQQRMGVSLRGFKTIPKCKKASPGYAPLNYCTCGRGKDSIMSINPQHTAVWQGLVPKLGRHGADIISQMLCLNPKCRVTASEALQHPFFQLPPQCQQQKQPEVTQTPSILPSSASQIPTSSATVLNAAVPSTTPSASSQVAVTTTTPSSAASTSSQQQPQHPLHPPPPTQQLPAVPTQVSHSPVTPNNNQPVVVDRSLLDHHSIAGSGQSSHGTVGTMFTYNPHMTQNVNVPPANAHQRYPPHPQQQYQQPQLQKDPSTPALSNTSQTSLLNQFTGMQLQTQQNQQHFRSDQSGMGNDNQFDARRPSHEAASQFDAMSMMSGDTVFGASSIMSLAPGANVGGMGYNNPLSPQGSFYNSKMHSNNSINSQHSNIPWAKDSQPHRNQPLPQYHTLPRNLNAARQEDSLNTPQQTPMERKPLESGPLTPNFSRMHPGPAPPQISSTMNNTNDSDHLFIDHSDPSGSSMVGRKRIPMGHAHYNSLPRNAAQYMDQLSQQYNNSSGQHTLPQSFLNSPSPSQRSVLQPSLHQQQMMQQQQQQHLFMGHTNTHSKSGSYGVQQPTHSNQFFPNNPTPTNAQQYPNILPASPNVGSQSNQPQLQPVQNINQPSSMQQQLNTLPNNTLKPATKKKFELKTINLSKLKYKALDDDSRQGDEGLEGLYSGYDESNLSDDESRR